MNLYLLTYTGPGDTEFKLVDKIAWDYIFSPAPDFPDGEYVVKENPPPSVVECIKRSYGDDMEEYLEQVQATTGSWQNDRALAVTYFINDKEAHFFSCDQLEEFLAEHPEIRIIGAAPWSVY